MARMVIAHNSAGTNGGKSRARSHCRFVLPPIHLIPESLTYSVPLLLKRQCDRTLGKSAEIFCAPLTIFQVRRARGARGVPRHSPAWEALAFPTQGF